jgi:hypothetical protein
MIGGEVPYDHILKYYKEPSRDNVILLLMRCKKLFEARIEAKRILMLLIMWKDMDIQHILERRNHNYSQDD